MGALMFDHPIYMPPMNEIWEMMFESFENEKFKEALKDLWIPLTNWDGYKTDPIRVMDVYFKSYADYVAKIFFEDEVQKTFVQSSEKDEGIVFTSLRTSEFYKGLLTNFKKYLTFHKGNFTRDYGKLVGEIEAQATDETDISKRFDLLRRISRQYSVPHRGVRCITLSTIEITKDLDAYRGVDEFNVLAVCRNDDEVVFEISKSGLSGIHDHFGCKERLSHDLHESYTYSGFYSQIIERLD